MDLLDYINRGGTLVYILIGLNVIGFSIMLFKLYVLSAAKRNMDSTANVIASNFVNKDLVQNEINVEIKKLELGLNTIKIIASISPLIGLLGTVLGVLEAFDAIS
ncbi:MAG: MotA/TolQ/ExbB proton channel family protein, partial [Campylobacteraceae bacterium]|nr:MotA/TolQ/ExbB proton channel family protein [Campylobacteraceae bacterium]